jgi:predicted nucleic acid-binding Zn ribbon protein
VDGGDGRRSPDDAEAPRGVDLARRALEQARAAAKERGVAVGRGGASPRRGAPRTPRSSRRRWSGPGADDRDPQTFASLAAGLVRSRGWSEEIAAGAVLGRWNSLVGADIADHAQPESLVGGELVVRAESTAWASQLRTLQRQILAKIAAGVGHGVVTKLTVRGPAAPSWKHGERTVRGRGPRDTYG